MQQRIIPQLLALFFFVLLCATAVQAQTYTIVRDSTYIRHHQEGNELKRMWLSWGIGSDFNHITQSPTFYVAGSFVKGDLLVSGRFVYVRTGGNLFLFDPGVPDQEYSLLVGKFFSTFGLSVSGSVGAGFFRGHMIAGNTDTGLRHGADYLQPAIVAQIDLGATLYIAGFSFHILGDLNARRPFGAVIGSIDLGKLWD